MFRWILKFCRWFWISCLCLIATCCNDQLRIEAMVLAQHELALLILLYMYDHIYVYVLQKQNKHI